MESSKARQIYLVLRDRIAGGHYADKAPLPVEQDLAAEHGVSRATVRRALAALEEESLITRRQGSGSFVSLDGKPRPIAADFSDALAHLTAMGRATSVQLLAFGYEEAPATVADALGLSPGALVQRSQDPADQRRVLVYVSDIGLEKHRQLRDRVRRTRRDLEERLGDERGRALRRLLQDFLRDPAR